MEVQCQTCNKIFQRNKNQILRNINNFCSRECAYRGIKINCISCNKEFYKLPRLNSHSFCRRCYNKDYMLRNPEKQEIKYKRERLRNRKIPFDSPLRKRKQNGYISSSGYKIIYKDHPNSWKCGRIHEHVFIMSEHLGRPIRKNENVHHINGNRSDNRIENLEIWDTKQPPGQRVWQKIKFYKEFLEEYGYEVKLLESISHI